MFLKIVVFGPLDAGKTTFVEALSGNKLLLKGEHKTITTSFDFVQLKHNGFMIQLYATPGHRRFSFMWGALARGMKGAVLVLDSTVGISQVDKDILEFITKFRVPYIIAANKNDLIHLPEQNIREMMDLPPEITIIHTSALMNQNLKTVLKTLVMEIKDKESEKMMGGNIYGRQPKFQGNFKVNRKN